MAVKGVKRIAQKCRADEQFRRLGKLLAAALVITGGLDLVSTNLALAAGQIEGNPLIRSVQASMGAWWSLPKMMLHLCLAYLVLWIPSKRALVVGGFVCLSYVLIIANNLYLVG